MKYPNYSDLSDSTVFITGGGSGIGAAFVSAFIEQGAKVAFVSLTEEPANALCDVLESRFGIPKVLLTRTPARC